MKKTTWLQLRTLVLVALSGNLLLSSMASAANTYTNITSTSVTVNFVTNSPGGNSSYGGTGDTWSCYIENEANNHVIQEYDGIPASVHLVNVTGLTPGITYTVYCADITISLGYQYDQFTTLTAQISHSAISGLTAPSIYGTPVTSITSDPQFTGTVSWTGTTSNGLFAQNTIYTATVTLTPVAGYTATGLASNFFSGQALLRPRSHQTAERETQQFRLYSLRLLTWKQSPDYRQAPVILDNWKPLLERT